MPLDAPITISQQAKNLQAVLNTWAVQYGGVAETASDLKNFWEQAGNNNDLPRILIVYNGESARGEFRTRSALDRVDRSWQVGVFRGRGFSAQRGRSLTNTVVNAMPFYDVVEQIRDLIRSILDISEEFPVEFISIRPMAPNPPTMIMDAYVIEFVTANDIPKITYERTYEPDPDPGIPPEIPTNLGVQYEPGPPGQNYLITWNVTTAPLAGFTIKFTNIQGGPYAEMSIPTQSGDCSFSWDPSYGGDLTPPSIEHQDMYLIIIYDNGGGNTAQTEEYHAVYNPP